MVKRKSKHEHDVQLGWGWMLGGDAANPSRYPGTRNNQSQKCAPRDKTKSQDINSYINGSDAYKLSTLYLPIITALSRRVGSTVRSVRNTRTTKYDALCC